MVLLAFGSGKSEIWPFFRNRAKSGSGQNTFSQIWRMLVQLHYIELIMNESNAADLSSGVFTILVSVTWMKKNTKIYCCSAKNFVKNWQKVT